MDEKVRAEFKREFNSAVGSLLASLRRKAGVSLEQLAEVYAKARLEKVTRLEAGEESLHGSDLMDLVRIYGDDLTSVSIEIQAIAEKAKAKFPLPSAPFPGAGTRTEGQPHDQPPNTL